MQITRDGLVFDVRDEGPRAGDPVLLLHGFPQTSSSWTPLAARLHAAGYRTLALDQRGYSPGARPRGVRAYALSELVADAVAVIDAVSSGSASGHSSSGGAFSGGDAASGSVAPDSAAFGSAGSGDAVPGSAASEGAVFDATALGDAASAGPPSSAATSDDATSGAIRAGRVHVVGHDWGAAVAWALAARHPERVASLTSLATPPPQALVRGFRRPRQALASWYIAAIMIPGLFERVHAWRPSLTAKLLERSGQTSAAVARDVAPLADRATLTAMLNWYRAMPYGGADPGLLVTRPVLYVWGSGDTALLRAAAEDAPKWVRGSFAYVELPEATHWFPEQNVDELAPIILSHLREHPL